MPTKREGLRQINEIEDPKINENFKELFGKVEDSFRPVVRGVLASDQTGVVTATTTLVALSKTGGYDRYGDFNNTGSRFTAAVDGFYSFSGQVWFESANSGDGDIIQCNLRKGGSTIVSTSQAILGSATEEASVNLTDIIYLLKGEYIQLTAYHNFGADATIKGVATKDLTHMSVFLIAKTILR